MTERNNFQNFLKILELYECGVTQFWKQNNLKNIINIEDKK